MHHNNAVRLKHRSDRPKTGTTLHEDKRRAQAPLSTRAISHGTTHGLVDASVYYLLCVSIPRSCVEGRPPKCPQPHPIPRNPTQPKRAEPSCFAQHLVKFPSLSWLCRHLLPFHGQSNRTGTTSTSRATECFDSSLRGKTTTRSMPRCSTAMGEGRTTTCCLSTGSPCSTTRGTRRRWSAPSRRTSRCTIGRRPACGPAGNTRSGTTLPPLPPPLSSPLPPSLPPARRICGKPQQQRQQQHHHRRR